MNLDPQIKKEVEAALGQKVPTGDETQLANFIVKLYDTEPELATKLNDGLYMEAVGDPKEKVIRAEQAHKRRKAVVDAALNRSDDLSGEKVMARPKIIGWSLLAIVLLSVGLMAFDNMSRRERVDTQLQVEPPAQAVADPDSADADSAEVELEATPEATPRDDLRDETAETLAELREFLDESKAVAPPAVELNEPVPAPSSVSVPAPSGEGADSAFDKTPVVVGTEDISGGVASLNAVTAANVVANAWGGAVVQAGELTPGSASATAPERNASSSATSTDVASERVASQTRQVPTRAEPAVSDAPENTPSRYEQPTQVQAQALQTPQTANSSPYDLGTNLSATTSVGVVTVGSSAFPILLETDDGAVWRGEASLSASGRMEVALGSVFKDGQTFKVNALVVGTDQVIGVKPTIREEAPALAADLLNGALRGVTDYVGELGDERDVIVKEGETLVQDSTLPLEWAVAGSVAELFAPQDTQKALVRVAELPAGTRVGIVVSN